MEDGTYGQAYIEANPLFSISASNPEAFAEQEGQSQDIEVAEPVDIRTTIKNLERNSRSYTYIVQVLDSDGKVVSLDLADTGLPTTAYRLNASQVFFFEIIKWKNAILCNGFSVHDRRDCIATYQIPISPNKGGHCQPRTKGQ